MLSRPKTIIYVSAIAFFSSPLHYAHAAPTITCARGLSFGRISADCTGSITVRGTNGSSTNNDGCHDLISGPIQNAICTVQTTGGFATQDVRITFTRASLPFDNAVGAGQVTLDNYLIQTASGSRANSHTFSSALLNPSHEFRVGGRLRFNENEPSGSYGSSLNIVVTAIP